MDIDSLTSLIRSRYDRFSASERRVADMLLASPYLMNGFTATELADAADVAKATITRFIGKLGLSNFDEFRRATRGPQAFAQGSPMQLMDDELAATHGDLQRLVNETLHRDTANLAQTYADFSLTEIADAVALLADARRVVFADFRKQFALAYYASTLFRVIRPNVELLPIFGASAVDGMIYIDGDDVVVMFPFRRPTVDQDVLSRAVVETGATLIAIGDVWPSPSNRRARIHFRCRTEGAGVFDSFVTPMSLINLLFTATANRLGDHALDRLSRLEDKHQTFRTFVAGYDSTVQRMNGS